MGFQLVRRRVALMSAWKTGLLMRVISNILDKSWPINLSVDRESLICRRNPKDASCLKISLRSVFEIFVVIVFNHLAKTQAEADLPSFLNHLQRLKAYDTAEQGIT